MTILHTIASKGRQTQNKNICSYLIICIVASLMVWTDPHCIIKMYKSHSSIVLLRFSFHSWVTAQKIDYKQEAHVPVCKVIQKLSYALKCH